MSLILGIIVGILIGAGVVYMLLSQTISQREKVIQQHQRTIKDLEHRHESRLKETVQSLQSDYQQKLEQKKAELSQQYEQHIQSLKQHIIQLKTTPKQKSSPLPTESPISASPISATSSSQKHTSQLTINSAPSPLSDQLSTPETLDGSDSTAPSVESDPLPEPMTTSSAVKHSIEEQLAQRQTLVSSISTMGASQNVNHLPELKKLSLSQVSEVREATATAIKAIVTSNLGHPAIQQVTPVLGKLSQDPDPTVRCAAVTALGNIPSYKSIPFVRRSLRDSDMRVVKAANDVIGRFRYVQSQSQKLSHPKTKNFRAAR